MTVILTNIFKLIDWWQFHRSYLLTLSPIAFMNRDIKCGKVWIAFLGYFPFWGIGGSEKSQCVWTWSEAPPSSPDGKRSWSSTLHDGAERRPSENQGLADSSHLQRCTMVLKEDQANVNALLTHLISSLSFHLTHLISSHLGGTSHNPTRLSSGGFGALRGWLECVCLLADRPFKCPREWKARISEEPFRLHTARGQFCKPEVNICAHWALQNNQIWENETFQTATNIFTT